MSWKRMIKWSVIGVVVIMAIAYLGPDRHQPPPLGDGWASPRPPLATTEDLYVSPEELASLPKYPPDDDKLAEEVQVGDLVTLQLPPPEHSSPVQRLERNKHILFVDIGCPDSWPARKVPIPVAAMVTDVDPPTNYRHVKSGRALNGQPFERQVRLEGGTYRGQLVVVNIFAIHKRAK